ncbi:CocE/NonD family hydrolase C-terminal non-catalytic domain-containing protein [Hymenobacter aranciens]|uniref:CocE/NonD family hydrolase C-terminal non-catalytic domain-containing protein n=1 Tax=Hymenobacter aranciens TaxID=3063996 RepID=UPI00350ED5E2
MPGCGKRCFRPCRDPTTPECSSTPPPSKRTKPPRGKKNFATAEAIGIVFYPGEQLWLVISSRNDLGAIMPGTPGFTPENKGQHIIHTGGAHRSYLQLPVKQPKKSAG